MKSHERFLLEVHEHLLMDISRYYQDGHLDTTLERDKSRLRSAVETRGSKVLTIDLPRLGKHFDACLDAARYVPAQLPFSGSAAGKVVPRLFEGLLSRVFRPDSGHLREDADVAAVCFLRQLYGAANKVRMQCDPSATYKAVEEFFRIESLTRSASLPWESDEFVPDPSLSLSDLDWARPLPLFGEQLVLRVQVRDALIICQQVADVIAGQLGQGFTRADLLPKHGPGAVSDARQGMKYTFPTWPKKLDAVFHYEDYAFHTWEAFLARKDWNWDWVESSHSEPASKLHAVPKTQKTPRLIAAEPTAHQWMQQAVARVLARAIGQSSLRPSIDLRDQAKSQDAARRASQTRSHATIDLSSASDRLSCWLVERLFRRNPEFLTACHAVRTRWLANNIDKKQPKYHKLRKFTTMGSALTFPVQSISFAIICIGCAIATDLNAELRNRRKLVNSRTIRRYARTIRVFGDDLIVPNDSYDLVVQVLTHLGLAVNQAKSYHGKSFRESCGLDAYAGVNVTPTYVRVVPNGRPTPSQVTSLVDCSNNLLRAGYWLTADYVASQIPEHIRDALPVIGVDSGAFGLAAFSGIDVSHLKKVWDADLQTELHVALTQQSSVERQPVRGTAQLLQWSTEAPSQGDVARHAPTLPIVWEPGEVVRSTAKVKLRRRGVRIGDLS